MTDLYTITSPTAWLFLGIAFITATATTFFLVRREKGSGPKRILAALFYFVISFLVSLGMLSMPV